MTTVKEILDQFNALYRYGDAIEDINIGNYTFDEAYIDDSGYVMEFVNTNNPDAWLRINDDRLAVVLMEKVGDDEVNVTSWNRHGKMSKKFPLKDFKPFPKNRQKPLPIKES